MSIKQQLKLDYKIAPLYSQKVSEIANNSKITYQNFETPGWSSIMHTDTNTQLSNRSQTNHNKILQRINKMNDIDLENFNYSKIKIQQNYKGIIYSCQRDKSSNQQNRDQRQYNKKHIKSLNDENNCKNHLQSTSIHSQSRYNLDHSLKKSNISRQDRSGTIIKNISRKQHNAEERKQAQKSKRFHHISVHQHLFLDSKRLQTKRMMEQVLQQQFKKKNVLLFQPSISRKSQKLAEIKFSRLKTREDLESELIQQLKQIDHQTISKKVVKTKQSIQTERQISQYHGVHKMFEFLSNKTQIITKETLKKVIEELPLVCIKFIEKIIAKIYQGKQYNWLQFLGSINDKKIVSNKQGLLVIFDKWANRQQRRQTQPFHQHQIQSNYCS